MKGVILMQKLLHKYESYVKELDDLIIKETYSEYDVLNTVIFDLVRSGGKRLRPLLMNLSGKFGGEYNQEKILKVAPALEILHMATLVHNDIIDDARLRRGTRSAQKKFGKNIAVFCGDYLLSQSFNIFVQHLPQEPLLKLSNIIKSICLGEIGQYLNKYNPDITFKQYLRRIRRKTAILFAFSTYLGAYLSGIRGKRLNYLYKIGMEIGMTFQIQDDLLDFSGKKEKLGKDIGKDLKEGIYTLPIICILQEEKEKVYPVLKKEKISQDEFDFILNLVKEKGIKESRKIMKKFQDKVYYYLDLLPDKIVKDDLKLIIEIQFNRKY